MATSTMGRKNITLTNPITGEEDFEALAEGHQNSNPSSWCYLPHSQFPKDYVGQFKPPSFAIYDRCTIEQWMLRACIKEGSDAAKGAFTDFPYNVSAGGSILDPPDALHMWVHIRWSAAFENRASASQNNRVSFNRKFDQKRLLY